MLLSALFAYIVGFVLQLDTFSHFSYLFPYSILFLGITESMIFLHSGILSYIVDIITTLLSLFSIVNVVNVKSLP